MNNDSDFDLKPDQWEGLKALRTPFARLPAAARFVLEDLVALGLATTTGRIPAITEKGRRVLIRGAFRLMDAAA